VCFGTRGVVVHRSHDVKIRMLSVRIKPEDKRKEV
jgi:hypothetical protein